MLIPEGVRMGLLSPVRTSRNGDGITSTKLLVFSGFCNRLCHRKYLKNVYMIDYTGWRRTSRRVFGCVLVALHIQNAILCRKLCNFAYLTFVSNSYMR